MSLKKAVDAICNEAEMCTLKLEYHKVQRVLNEMMNVQKEREIGNKKIRWWVFAIIYSVCVFSLVTYSTLSLTLMILVFVWSLAVTIIKLCFALPTLIILTPIKIMLEKAERGKGLIHKIVCK